MKSLKASQIQEWINDVNSKFFHKINKKVQQLIIHTTNDEKWNLLNLETIHYEEDYTGGTELIGFIFNLNSYALNLVDDHFNMISQQGQIDCEKTFNKKNHNMINETLMAYEEIYSIISKIGKTIEDI